jgi:hypothetical protein
VNNGILEAMCSLIQAAKRRARGYRTTENLIAIALTLGKLDFAIHTKLRGASREICTARGAAGGE